MANNKLKWGLIVILVVVIGGGIATFIIFKQPERDVQAAVPDYNVKVKDIVHEYLADSKTANAKYLESKGESKVLTVEGIVSEISVDLKQQKVVLLREPDHNAGVSCTFMLETNQHVDKMKIGDVVVVKGVIRSGASYDYDLELYEDVILEKCDIVTGKVE